MNNNDITVLVLGGGNSPERDVSLRSAKNVADSLREAGFNVMEADPRDGLGILDQIDKSVIVFPILHGAEGEDGKIQSEMEKRGLKYLGTDSKCSFETFNKMITDAKLEENGVRVPVTDTVTRDTYRQSKMASKPHVLKVLRGGSSIGVYIVRDPNNIDQKKVDEVFDLDSDAQVEELIVGLEVTVPVLGDEVLPVIEIVPPENAEFDYENKYNGATQELCPPLHVSEDLQRKSQEVALRAHQIMGCRHISRTDIMIDQEGNLYVIDINTIPGMTEQSLLPKSALVAGYTMPELMKKFVALVSSNQV